MKTLKEKWQDVNPILLGILLVIVLIYLIIIGIGKLIPSAVELNNKRIEQIEQCKQANLDYALSDLGYLCIKK